ncbi:entericidin A/B family lipoprotein [Pontivivens insulae]|uniref:Entericidin B membrane lipoprotein n=1 Tax=Pontivivens insulae TaxID=1639689 RepID=A0A2R8A8C5_9RHOB|nr:entericidin A/B family lipoprotein [Pontivivens insulae]RED18578.1 putative small secreted protein [Pontivivens insulae]SPF28476.1 hypothetical protein POI8812_00777 [Pontivivens insulae]
MTYAKLGLIGAALLALAACNTIQGVGQDVQDGGRALENAVTN